MPISTTGDERDSRYSEYDQEEMFEQRRRLPRHDAGPSGDTAQTARRRCGRKGQAPRGRRLARLVITPTADGVSVEFDAHDELFDDLVRRFEDMADREL